MRFIAVPLTVLFLGVACDDSTAPTPTTGEISLAFCPGDIPDWFAIRNDGDAWEAVTHSNGTFTFQATPRVSVAFVYADGDNISTEVHNATATELEASTRFQCSSPSSTRNLSGSVAGLTGEQVARMSMAGDVAQATAAHPSYGLSSVLTGSRDLVAARFASEFSSPADRVIVKRALDPAPGTPLPTLGFASSDAQPLISATLTLANLGTDLAHVGTEFITANGAHQQLGTLTLSGGTTAVSYVSVPDALRVSSDLQKLSIVTTGVVGVRTVTQYYSTPTNKTITIGPMVNVPTISDAATSPYVRPRAQLASQPEYQSAVEFDYTQFIDQVFRAVYVVTTSGFLGGTPVTWDVTVPDFSGTGYLDEWGLVTGESYSRIVHAFNGSPGDLLPMAPAQGVTLISATRNTD